MLTKAQTIALSERIKAIRNQVVEVNEGLRDHHETMGSRDAQRRLECALVDLDTASVTLRLEVTRTERK